MPLAPLVGPSLGGWSSCRGRSPSGPGMNPGAGHPTGAVGRPGAAHLAFSVGFPDCAVARWASPVLPFVRGCPGSVGWAWDRGAQKRAGAKGPPRRSAGPPAGGPGTYAPGLARLGRRRSGRRPGPVSGSVRLRRFCSCRDASRAPRFCLPTETVNRCVFGGQVCRRTHTAPRLMKPF